MCFGSQRPFFRKYYPYSGRQAQYACIPRRQPEAGGSPLNAVSTVPVGRQVMPGDARKGGATMNVIAYIRNDFQEKFGIPRQSGVVETALSEIVFEPDYRSAEALRGVEGFSHVWLIWAFSASAKAGRLRSGLRVWAAMRGWGFLPRARRSVRTRWGCRR